VDNKPFAPRENVLLMWLRSVSTAELQRTADTWLVVAEEAARAGDENASRQAMLLWHAVLDELDRRRESGEGGDDGR
jgi:hypothetical protein